MYGSRPTGRKAPSRAVAVPSCAGKTHTSAALVRSGSVEHLNPKRCPGKFLASGEDTRSNVRCVTLSNHVDARWRVADQGHERRLLPGAETVRSSA